jgi:hypothetical protein
VKSTTRATNKGQLRALVMDLKSNGVENDTVETIAGLIAVTLSQNPRLDVLSGADVRQLIALEGEKQSLGCADDSSCLADVAGAMGAQLIVFGNAGRLGTLLNINLNLFDATEARSVGRVAVQAKNLEELPERLRPALDQLMAKALANAPGAPVITQAPPSSGPGVVPWLVVGGGAVSTTLGVVGLVLAGGNAAAVSAGAQGDFANPVKRAQVLKAAQDAQAAYANGTVTGEFAGGLALTVVGLGAAAGGLVWALSSGSKE